jgi:predicted transcriptional regulator
MVMQVTVNLPEETYRRAKRLAQLTRREVADVLADTLSLSLPSLAEGSSLSMQSMADDQVFALTKLQLSAVEEERLSALLESQQAGELADNERSELNRLMQVYQEGLLLKSEALAEAVSRGLIPPLSS